jgi:hypothetical protein
VDVAIRAMNTLRGDYTGSGRAHRVRATTQSRSYSHTVTCSTTPIARCSLARTAAFTGSRYVPRFVSNQIAVSHCVRPIRAVTPSLPQPPSNRCMLPRISCDMDVGNDTNHQPPLPGYCHISAENVYGMVGGMDSADGCVPRLSYGRIYGL